MAAGGPSEKIARTFDDRVYPGGLTYSGHPLACAVGVATFRVFERDGILDRVKDLGARVIQPELESWLERRPSLGEVRGAGLFWALELVGNRETREPLVPFNAMGADAAPMAELAAECKRARLWPFVHFNRMHIAPPLIIAEDELKRGLSIIDKVLDIADRYVA
jgi:taurine--2-oxoglutarate transaminase